ncbi:hypothetical protein BCV69DRAFT_131503 [Microstroma glucosiphilum]|uniref:Uncharacterized protein n=1 Tax=Pseudomicrostroma glucosiphilum TaxID=1684307 RepID=A0A316TXT2_9BASI|nr:hypothetical protein BCV69DRAFT_131503 [Pseudomicrostroma glucosiphilum]PWN17648.1 hypothetical protein BCV69DRAFT_131503 [Pseudomicrostroma glucosiphilum]
MISCLEKILEQHSHSVSSAESIDLAWLRRVESNLDDLFLLWYKNGRKTTRAYYKKIQATNSVRTSLSDYTDKAAPSGGTRGTSVRDSARQIVNRLFFRPSRSLVSTSAVPLPSSSNAFLRPMYPLLECRIYDRLQRNSNWRHMDLEWCRLFSCVTNKVRDVYRIAVKDAYTAAHAATVGRTRRLIGYELPWLPEVRRIVYSERDIYSRIHLLELLREGCRWIITTGTLSGRGARITEGGIGET